jgi:hypothetical protein
MFLIPWTKIYFQSFFYLKTLKKYNRDLNKSFFFVFYLQLAKNQLKK